MSSDVSALEQASTNASHGISILSTADGGAANISDILERMKTLASQSASGTVTDTERTYIEAEFDQLVDGRYRHVHPLQRPEPAQRHVRPLRRHRRDGCRSDLVAHQCDHG
ncbi:flagellin [Breoghania sp.]|uniref:flagellin n=1 Tax=Breoghania sp. TaxID=2065378 RepID=UPI00262C83A0|nr:flagellin [Breoghania sp.]MDJ0932510.1 flagellin [Breoghania sp.]